MEVWQIKDLLPQSIVAMQYWQTGSDCADQTVVDCNRYIINKEGGFQCRGLVARLGEIDIGLDRVGQRAGQGVAVIGELGVEGIEGILSHGAVRALEE